MTRRVGVIGAGTMGAGIAQLAAQAGAETLVFDAHADVEAAMAKVAQRWERKGLEHATPRAVAELEDLTGCDVVIEAAPERLELKQELFARLGERDPGVVLASNTSSIPISAIAAGVPGPERVVGMHFFNPAPVMRLLEVIPGLETSDATVARARELGEAMDREVIVCADVAGFVVNRTNRPFGLEALRLLQERVADVETIDRIVRMGGGFPMGPFELQDLVGLDVTLEVQQSFAELSFGEPRWRPSPLLARQVAAGRLGRKSGRGWYAGERDEDPVVASCDEGDGRLLVIAGELPVAEELRGLAAGAGWDVREPEDADGEVPYLNVDCGGHEGPPLQGAPLAVLCAEASLAVIDEGGAAIGFHAIPPVAHVELMTTAGTSKEAEWRAMEVFDSFSMAVNIGDAPGGVLGRIVCQVINEACFTLGEGIASAEEIDAGMRLGLNHPRGPLEWARLIGLEHVLAVLDGLYAEYREERYRAAPLLRRAVAAGADLT